MVGRAQKEEIIFFVSVEYRAELDHSEGRQKIRHECGTFQRACLQTFDQQAAFYSQEMRKGHPIKRVLSIVRKVRKGRC